jgi:hypothetical protein
MLYLDNGMNVKDIYKYIQRKTSINNIDIPDNNDIDISAEEIDDAKLRWFKNELRHNAEQLRMKNVFNNWLLYKD